jgi:hypothetical protein
MGNTISVPIYASAGARQISTLLSQNSLKLAIIIVRIIREKVYTFNFKGASREGDFYAIPYKGERNKGTTDNFEAL